MVRGPGFNAANMRAFCEIAGDVRVRPLGDKEVSCEPDVAFIGAVESRPPCWGGRQPEGIPPVYHNDKVSVLIGQPEHSS